MQIIVRHILFFGFGIPHEICSCLTFAGTVAIQVKYLPDTEVRQLGFPLPFVTKIMPQQEIGDPREQALKLSETIAKLISDLDLTSALHDFQVPMFSFERIIERTLPDGKTDIRYKDFVTLLENIY
ncbi:unnamed protein product [Rotaria magnacalcarata]|uniref:Uncharacterized protein n=1 Tax=Rotaria magnacalcarata TaxID=392030 RepID=A0A816GL71_9BILA|nr:unnamed protein product [Rotaria magnacalcarata]CAF4606277.1 unnamed protein product [Rotaria magnacalcarata]